VNLSFGLSGNILGNVCVDTISAKRYTHIFGDAVALQSSGTAVTFRREEKISGEVVTGGGSVVGLQFAEIGGNNGHPIIGGAMAAPSLSDCALASCNSGSRQSQFTDTVLNPTTPGFNLGAIQVKRTKTLRVPAAGTMPPGPVVIDITNLKMLSYGTITLAGGTTTTTVIVRIGGPMTLGRKDELVLSGLTEGQVIFVVDGPVKLGSYAKLHGTVLGESTINIGYRAEIDGAAIGMSTITMGTHATVDLIPYIGW